MRKGRRSRSMKSPPFALFYLVNFKVESRRTGLKFWSKKIWNFKKTDFEPPEKISAKSVDVCVSGATFHFDFENDRRSLP